MGEFDSPRLERSVRLSLGVRWIGLQTSPSAKMSGAVAGAGCLVAAGFDTIDHAASS